MNELTFHEDAHEICPISLDLIVHVMVQDREGNCLQVVPVKCEGICYPYGGNVGLAVVEVVRQLNGKIAQGTHDDRG